MSILTLSIALLMGLTGSLHCAGMCGPIVWIMPFGKYKGLGKIVDLSLYHIGRISVYAAMAILLHSFAGLFHPGVQQYISIILGISLLLAGVLSFFPGIMLKVRLPWADAVKMQLGNIIGNGGFITLLVAGILNGLLPCGLVYMALSAAVALHTPLQAAAFMYFFGLGTLPMLVGISLLKSRLSFAQLHSVKRLVPVVVFALGCLLVLRGMNLGIPYVSPKVAVAHHAIKSSCCHK